MYQKDHITAWMIPILREAGFKVRTLIYMAAQDAVWVSYPDRQFRIETPGTGADLLKAIVDGIREEEERHGARGKGISATCGNIV